MAESAFHGPATGPAVLPRRQVERQQIHPGQGSGLVTHYDACGSRMLAAAGTPVDEGGGRRTHDLVTIGPEADESEARQRLAQHQLDRLLVVEADNHLVGIISESDLSADQGPLA